MAKLSIEKAVKGATKIKYIEDLLLATHSGERGMMEMFRHLRPQIMSSTWTVSFKALIVVHLMMREGDEDTVLKYLCEHPQRMLSTDEFTGIHPQRRNIETYANYLIRRALTYRSTGHDYLRSARGRLKELSVDKGLIRETEVLSKQFSDLLKCQNIVSAETYNEVTISAFKLLVQDLLLIFVAMNEAMVNILDSFFDLSHSDAERVVQLYRSFTKLTDRSCQFFETAQQYESLIQIRIPPIKHISTSLADSLEKHLKDPQNFSSTGAKLTNESSSGGVNAPSSSNGSQPPREEKPAVISPAELNIDLLSIDDDPAPQTQAAPAMANPNMGFMITPGIMNPMQTGAIPAFQIGPMGGIPGMTGMFPQQLGQIGQIGQMGQLGQVMPFATRAGVAGPQIPATMAMLSPQMMSLPQGQMQTSTATSYSPFLQPAQTGAPAMASSIQPTQTGLSASSNPFRKSTLPPAGPTAVTEKTKTNPFARARSPGVSDNGSSPAMGAAQAQPLAVIPAGGLNPFGRTDGAGAGAGVGSLGVPKAATLAPQATGTNPFRVSMMPTGQHPGLQHGMGGGGVLEQMSAVSVFPRPGVGQGSG